MLPATMGFWSLLYSPWFNPVRALSYPYFRNKYEQSGGVFFRIR